MSMNIVLVAGSSQQASQSSKVAGFLAARLRALALCAQPQVIDLGAAPLPLWPAEDVNGAWADHSAVLREADALVEVLARLVISYFLTPSEHFDFTNELSVKKFLNTYINIHEFKK